VESDDRQAALLPALASAVVGSGDPVGRTEQQLAGPDREETLVEVVA
jgi:hypothetical protein